MNVVSDILKALDDAVATAGETFFTNTATSLGPLATALMAILLAAIGLNAALNVYRISMRDAVQVSVRIVLIFMFGLSWANFGTFYAALTDGTQNLALSFFDLAGGALSKKASVVDAMDDLSGQMAETVDAVSKSQGSIMRGMVSTALYVVMGILMAAYVVIAGFAKIMVAFLLGVAPLAIMATVFDKTKNLFETWLGAFIGYLMWPVAAAGVIGTVITMANRTFAAPDEVSNLGSILGFLVSCFVGIIALRFIPNAASHITGQINLASATPDALHVLNKPLETTRAYSTRRMGEIRSGLLHGTTSGLAKHGQARRDADWGRDLARRAEAKMARYWTAQEK